MLEIQTYGAPGDDLPILIVHGLFGSGRNWGVIAKRLAADAYVVTVDLRNHGTSFRADSQSYPEMAADLAQVITHLGGRVDLVGHSMGGKTAMWLALTQPEMVRRLIVADIAPVPYGHTQSHLVAAMKALDLETISNRREADEELARNVDTPSVRAFLLQSLDMRDKRWLLNLDVLDRDMSLVTGFPDIDAQFDGPTFFLAGAESDYVLPEYRERIKELFPRAKQAKIPGTGHWLHAEKPREFEAAVRAFFGLPSSTHSSGA